MDEEIVSNSEEAFQDTLTKGNELIDATQNAIIDAAENVTGIFDKATNSIPPAEVHLTPFYTEVEFWVGMAFVLSVIALLKPLFSYIHQALQRRIQRVIQSIDEAAKLRDDAQALLADYERKHQNAEHEAQTILENTKKSLNRFKETELTKQRQNVAIKEKDVERRIKASTEKVRHEVSSSISEKSVILAQKAIQKYLQETDKSRLVDDAIAELDKFIK